MVFLVRGRGPENIKENIKTNRRKTLIIEDKGKRKMQGKSKNNNEHLWFYFFIKTYILLKDIVAKVKNTLRLTTQIFIAMDCLILNVREVSSF